MDKNGNSTKRGKHPERDPAWWDPPCAAHRVFKLNRDRVRESIVERGMSMNDIARAAGCSGGTVSNAISALVRAGKLPDSYRYKATRNRHVVAAEATW